MKFGLKHFHAPTPKLMKRIGNALFVTFGSGAVVLVYSIDSKALAIGCFILGSAGKFITECFTNNNDSTQ